MCNYLHHDGARCTGNLKYDLFDGEADSDTECSFIESLRFGAYNENGQFASAYSGMSWNEEPSIGQKVGLGLSVALCMFCIIYACYLHHAMTNLLIKSLSHRELLPPSRHKSRRGTPKGFRRRLQQVSADDDEWEGEAA
jgi:hypothetical protein